MIWWTTIRLLPWFINSIKHRCISRWICSAWMCLWNYSTNPSLRHRHSTAITDTHRHNKGTISQTQQSKDTTKTTPNNIQNTYKTPVVSEREVSLLHNLYARQLEMQLNKSCLINPSTYHEQRLMGKRWLMTDDKGTLLLKMSNYLDQSEKPSATYMNKHIC